LRDEWRLENRQAFANIWSDIVYGAALFLIMYFNQSKVSIYRISSVFVHFHTDVLVPCGSSEIEICCVIRPLEQLTNFSC
jgi:hypothetical protein